MSTTGVQMDDAPALLDQERQLTIARLAMLTDDFDKLMAASRDSNADDEHDTEGATIAFERSQLDIVVQQARAHLAEIDAAQVRLAAGTYGTCERCGSQIPAERLLARSTARSCVTCVSG